MIINKVADVNAALARGIYIAMGQGQKEDSRNGPVRVVSQPVMTETIFPMRRVLSCPLRDANPFFHLFESLWMLGGREDLPWLTQFNKQMGAYSDDGGQTQPAAYGFRWRKFFGHDQIELVVDELRQRPDSRRAVLAMWDPGFDVPFEEHSEGDMGRALAGSADVPCNTHCYFRIRQLGGMPFLDMTVCCRSNDLYWGAHGANAVHFSVLQEYIAAKLDVHMGTLYQFSNNYHLYPEAPKHEPKQIARSCLDHNHYDSGAAKIGTTQRVTPLFTPGNVAQFDAELDGWLAHAAPNGGTLAISHPTFTLVAQPMLDAWRAWKRKDVGLAKTLITTMPDGDWRAACLAWLDRRDSK